MDFNFSFQEILLVVPGVLLGFVLHEFAHAVMADKLGDPTPRSQGKITLDPRAHIDILGFIMIIIFKFGWAKPVMTNPKNFRKPRRDDILVSIAGPVMNLLIAIVFLYIIKIVDIINFLPDTEIVKNMYSLLLYTASTNVMLFVLNLLPLPGFDGYHVITNLFNTWKYQFFNTLEQYSTFIFMILVFTNILSKILVPIKDYIFIFLLNTIIM